MFCLEACIPLTLNPYLWILPINKVDAEVEDALKMSEIRHIFRSCNLKSKQYTFFKTLVTKLAKISLVKYTLPRCK